MMRRQQQQRQHHDQQSRVFYELSSLVLSLLRSPPSPMPYADQTTSPALITSTRRTAPPPSALAQITPAGFASLMLGISVALMLCGSVTFFIGFMLMPWVLGLVMVFYVAGIVSAISVLGKAIFCYAMAPPSSPRKEIPAFVKRVDGLEGYTDLCTELNMSGPKVAESGAAPRDVQEKQS